MMDQNCQYMHNGKVPRFLVYHKCFKSAEAVRHRLYVATELDISEVLLSREYIPWFQHYDRGYVTEWLRRNVLQGASSSTH